MTDLIRNEHLIMQDVPYTPEDKTRMQATPEEIDWGKRFMEARTAEDFNQLNTEREALAAARENTSAEIRELAIEEGRLLGVDELKHLYGDLLEVDRPMTPTEAALKYTGKKKEAIRQSILSRGQGGFAAGAAKFGVALLDVATDPVELTIGLVSTLIIPWTGGTLPARFGVAASEAFVGSVLTEPAYYALSKRQQLDYTANEALLNIALGTLLGGTLGAVLAPRLRGSEGAAGDVRVRLNEGTNLPTSREQDLANVALRQFVNDEAVSFAAFGRDMRGTTSLVSVRGIEFQPEYTRDLQPIGPVRDRPRPTVLIVDGKGNPRTFDTPASAMAAAASVGGTAQRTNTPGLYTIRRDVDADFVLDAGGSPLTFPNKAAANKFISTARKDGLLPKAAEPVLINRAGERDLFGIVGNTDKDAKAMLRAKGANVRVPKGPDTQQIALAPEQDLASVVKPFTRGAAAYEKVATDFSTGKEPAVSTAIDVKHATDQEVKDAAEEIENFREMLGDEEVTEIAQIETETNARLAGIKEAMTCMVRNT